VKLVILRDIFRQNGYTDRQIRGLSNLLRKFPGPTENQIQILSCLVSDRYLNTLAGCCVGTTSSLWVSLQGKYQVKDDLGLKTQWVYSTPPVNAVIPTLGRQDIRWDTRLNKHQRNIRLEYQDKSPEAENSINLGHHIQLHHTAILLAKPRYMGRIAREWRSTVSTWGTTPHRHPLSQTQIHGSQHQVGGSG
jgi:hypothetical protein